MRDLIKVVIALVFVAGAFWIGKYNAEVKYKIQINERNAKVNANNKLIRELRDSISTLTTKMAKEKTKKKNDPTKLQ